MLNQNDFRKILSTPVPNASGGGKGIGGGNDKTRFDMKQIASWERENRGGGGKGGKKPFKKHKLPPGMAEAEDEDGDAAKAKYRDRALERQKDINPDYNIGIYFDDIERCITHRKM